MNIWKEKLHHWNFSQPDKNALLDEKTTFSFHQLLQISNELKTLVEARECRNNRILVILPRTAEAAALLIAILTNDYVPIFLDPKSSELAVTKTIQNVKPGLIIGTSLKAADGSFLFSGSLSFRYQKLIHEDGPTCIPQELKWLLHTSGSTGESKAVMISDANLLERTTTEIEDFGLTQEDRIMNCLSFTHDLGLNQLLTSFFVGATLFVKTNAFMGIAEFIKLHGITGITGTPLMWIDFLKNYDSKQPLRGLRYLTISGGSLTQDNISALKKVFPETEFIATYGQTETYRTFINTKPSNGDLGRLVKNVNIHITDEGELRHSGPTSMLGYFPEKSLSPYVETKDLVMIRDGNYFFQGRKDDLIKRFEHRFHLNEIQHYFTGFEEIKEAVIVTLPTHPHDWKQYHLGVFLLLKKDKTLNPEELKKRSMNQLPYFKAPDVIKVMEDFPRTASFKPDRKLFELLLSKELV